MINYGLERSRFIAFLMTPAYFDPAGSGWTDAEWHAALHTDPDNRRARLIPLLGADCPYIPVLLRHLSSIDMRGSRFAQGVEDLVRTLRDEPIPRPVSYRGQLIQSGGCIDRTTLIAERSIPQGDPDPVAESLSCNLLPVERLPVYLYDAPVLRSLKSKTRKGASRLPSKNDLKRTIMESQLEAGIKKPTVPAFRFVGGRIMTFHDLESDESPFSAVIDYKHVEPIRIQNLLRDEDSRRIVASLISMGLTRHLIGQGLQLDNDRNRFFFPPENNKERTVAWKPMRKRTERTVAKPYFREGRVEFWLHQAAYIRPVFLAAKFFIQITPTWLLTTDGQTVKGGPKVGRVVIQWIGRERNLSILYHVRFWTMMLRRGPGPISIKMGDQTMEVATVPAYVQQPYGIRHDQKDLLPLLDEVAPMIANEEATAEVETQPFIDDMDDQDSSLGVPDLHSKGRNEE